ncbi:lipase family protein [Rhodococcus maanshanensis]|uniref:Secretory lipase n=1 Tax=Rhodococcus maanshanensis TaxID=183556 RepID=A0A1H7SXT9_9NOCA|nr:lipase family protein [Rhodococcus maanshanensis]SEL77278.1 Secretory lipase [Rhodococcus maanshanensis]
MYARLAAAILTAMLLTTTALAAPAATVPTGPPGSVTASRQLPHKFWIPDAVDASVVTYWSTGPGGRPALSTGAVFIPPGQAPPGGWPVVSWGHGAVGLADECAPTATGVLGGGYLTRWLTQGYAVVATDYVGLSTPGIHPYLDGRSQAHSVVDMVRAARAIVPSLSRKWVALGQSQGGQAAMVAASLATSYAPELDYRGAVGLGVPSNIENLAPLGGPGFPELPLTGTTVFISYLLAGLRATRPDIDLDGYLSPLGREVLDRAESLCYLEAAEAFAGISIGELLSRQLDDPVILSALREMLEIPVRGYDRPFFVGQGVLDEVVPAPLTLKLVADLAGNGERFTFRPYPAGHLGTMRLSLPDATDFVREAFLAP